MDTVNWTRELDEMVREAVARYGTNDWGKVCQKLRTQHITPEQCQARWENVLREQTVKGPWSEEEDAILRSLVEKFGPKKWSTIASYINGRIGKQCRERWLNHLSPNVSKDVWTEEEDEILINAQIQMGNKWSYISKLLPGRSENAVKNRYNSIASRNGVRKKRLGTFVNRNQLNRNNLLKIQMSAKREESTRSQPRVNKSYDVVMKKAEEHFNCRGQRLSIQLPSESAVQQSITNSFQQTPIKERKDTQFPFDVPGSPGQPIDLSSIASPYHLTHLSPFTGIVDTSEMTLSDTADFYNYQQEELNLQQIDSCILSGNTIMGNIQDSKTFEGQSTLFSEPMSPVMGVLSDLHLSENGDFSTLPQPIPPVHLRDNAKMPTVNRGVYSSWDPDPLNISTSSINSSHTPFGVPNSLNTSRRSIRYESMDLIRILNESEPEYHPDSLSLFENSIILTGMNDDDSPLLS